MKIILRADEANGTHTKFTVFVNGANCGQLCMREDEVTAFYMIIQNGTHPEFDKFVGKGNWKSVEVKQ